MAWLASLIGLALVGCIPSSDPPPVATSAADLSSLEVSAGPLSPPFAAATASYVVTVGNGVTSTTITATPAQTDATLQINNQPAQSGQPFGPIPLNVGQNPIPIVVTPKGSPPKSYTITVIRSANVNLVALSFSAGPLSPSFGTDVVSYTVAAPNGAAQTTITATAEQAGSTITIGGVPASSGQPFGPVPLTVGANTFSVLVRGSDTISTKEYTVLVNRAASSNATLSNLQVVPGQLTPAFSPAVTAYTVANIGLFTASVAISATTQDPNATLTINGQAVGSGIALQVPVAIGTTSIPVQVRAQDTVTVTTYTVEVSRCLFGPGPC